MEEVRSRTEYVLQARGIVKEFSGIRVLDKVDFDLKRGEVHALMGENGAGKSTLVKILTGVYSKTEGEVLLDGKGVEMRSKADSEKAGISIIFQEFSQVPQLTIAENLFLGKRPHKRIGPIRLVDWKAMTKTAKKWLEEFHIDDAPSARIQDVGVAKMQLVEIIKAILANARILIMDEPTASLSSGEIEFLFEIVRDLKRKGVSIIYISHRMEEIQLICDRVTVLRDGKKVATEPIERCDTDTIVRMMIGKTLADMYPEGSHMTQDTLLEVADLCSKGKFEHVSFSVRRGEILGITGLVGAGKTEIAQALFGIDQACTGTIRLEGEQICLKSPTDAKNKGIVLVPEDRKFQGVVVKLKAADNIGLPSLGRFKNRVGMINLKRERENVRKFFGRIDIRPNDPDKLVRQFSGGNQQKIVIAKWLCSGAKLFIFDEPTRGIDVGAKSEIYKLIANLAAEGCGIILCSSEIQEILGMSDRILVMNRGQVTSELGAQDADLETVLKKQIGGVKSV